MAERQHYPVGDLENGQLVQVSQPLPSSAPIYFDHETVTVTSTAGSLTPPIAAVKAFLTLETAAIRFWVDGLDLPTATAGHQLEVGDTLELDNADEIRNFRVIRRDAVNATLYVSYGRAA